MHSSTDLAAYLARTVASELPHLRALSDGPATTAVNRASGAGWSQRQELGHLIDSAVNNHVRIVRAALHSSYEGPGYDPDAWIETHRYQEQPWPELVDLWHAHNRVLVPLVANLAPTKLGTPCAVGSDPPVTLGFLIDDYVLHMRHHIDQILRRQPVTKYPRD